VRACEQSRGGAHSEIHHEPDLGCIHPVRIYARVRTKGDRHADPQSVLEHRAVCGGSGARLGGDLGGESPRVRLLADPVRRHASRDEIDAFGLHQLQGVLGEESAVLDRIHTRLDSDPRGGVSVAVSGDLSFPLVSFGYDRRHFLQCELRHIHRVGLGQHAAAGGELDDIRTPFHLVARGFAALLGAAADALDRPERVHALGREGVPVRVAARGADDVTGGQHARPFGDPGVDRVAQPDVDEVVGAHVAHGSEPCSERALCVQRGIQSLFGRETHHLVVDVVVIVPLEFIGKMRMGVDEAREKGRIAQIDNLCSGGRRACPHRHDPVAPHDHSGAVLERRAGRVEQMRGLEHEGFGRGGHFRRRRRFQCSDEEAGGGEHQRETCAHPRSCSCFHGCTVSAAVAQSRVRSRTGQIPLSRAAASLSYARAVEGTMRTLPLFVAALLSAPARADLLLAQLAYQMADYESAFKEYRELAELGQPVAQYNLAVMYAKGQGVRQSELNAYAWATLAVEGEYGPARALAEKLRPELAPGSEKIAADMVAPFSRAALDERLMPKVQDDEGSRTRCRLLGAGNTDYPLDARRNGIQGDVVVDATVPPDGSTRNPRVVYAIPSGVFEPTARAMALHLRWHPADKESRAIHCYMTYRFQMPLGKSAYPDLESLVRNALKKAEAGDPSSELLYGLLVAGLPQLGRPKSEAVPWFLKAAQAGSRTGQYMIGSSLLFGMGCRCEENKGETWLRRAAEADEPNAQVALAAYALRGVADDKNTRLA